jgi:phosphoglycolate phosphatase-like HAD superfamily hydrolase
MTTSLETSKNFQDKIFERIRESIGDLMTDEDLAKLVDAALQKAFFENRKTVDTWGRVSSEKSPLIVEVVQQLMQKRVEEQVDIWLKENHDKYEEIIEKVLAKGMFDLMVQHFESLTKWPLSNLFNELRNKGVIS